MDNFTAPLWLRTQWKTKLVNTMETSGRLLDGMALRGDVEGITVKFPTIESAPRPVILTGSIQPTEAANIGTGEVSVSLVDRELADFIKALDLTKMGPNLKDAKITQLAKSFGREHDLVLLEALSAFADNYSGGDTITVGNGSGELTLQATMKAKAQIAGTGADAAGKIYCVIPQMVFEAFKTKNVFANSDWIGGDDLPLTNMSGVDKKSWNGVHYIALPDIYFDTMRPADDQDYCFMWHHDAVGVEANLMDGPVRATVRNDLQGDPWQIKDIMSTAAVGLQKKGVRRFHVAQTTDVPAVS